jgi:hypothetical protein
MKEVINFESSDNEKMFDWQEKRKLKEKVTKRKENKKMKQKEEKQNCGGSINRGNSMRELFEKFIAFSEKEKLESENEDEFWESRMPNRS